MAPRIKISKWKNFAISILIVLVIIGACVVALAFNIAETRRTAVRAYCSANLKGIATNTALYAYDWSDQLPSAPPSFHGSWLCDQPLLFKSMTAVPSGMRPLEDRCPANVRQTPALLAGNPAAGYVVSGYAWTNDRSTDSGAVMPSFPATSRIPPLGYHRQFAKVGNNSTTELATDWIISDKSEPGAAEWTGIAAPSRPGTYDSSHMKGATPEGANEVMFDGHVEWSAFDPAKATPVQQGGPATAPYFWFPNH